MPCVNFNKSNVSYLLIIILIDERIAAHVPAWILSCGRRLGVKKKISFFFFLKKKKSIVARFVSAIELVRDIIPVHDSSLWPNYYHKESCILEFLQCAP